MKKLVLAGAALVAMSLPSFAADLPVKAPVVVPPPVFSWAGFYVGASVGYGWADTDNNLAVVQTDSANDPVRFASSRSTTVDGMLGGLHLGYNWQLNNIVFGIETDISATAINGTDRFDSSFFVPTGPGVGQQLVGVSHRDSLNWLGTTRGRIGFANDKWLFFATGGVAYGEVKVSGFGNAPIPFGGFGSNAPWVWSGSDTKVGWAAGVGLEYALSRNITWKVEYLYVDLGEVTGNVSGGLGNAGGPATNCYGPVGGGGCSFYRNSATGTVVSDFAVNIVRMGFNMKF